MKLTGAGFCDKIKSLKTIGVDDMYKTMQEIEREYDGNWVFMVNCRKGEYHNIAGGEVIAADKNREPIIELWGKSHDSEPYFRYVGALPEEIGGYLL